MTEQGFAACLAAILNGEVDVNESFDPDGIHHAVPYDEAGVLTRNAGLVVRMDDGAEFQITIVRSRGGR
jgi:hypothetical protein